MVIIGGLKSIARVTGKIVPFMAFYQLFFLFCIVIGASSQPDNVLKFSDMMILAPAFPNIIGLYILVPELKRDLDLYIKKIKSGVIKKSK